MNTKNSFDGLTEARKRSYMVAANISKQRMMREAPLSAAALEAVETSDIVVVRDIYDHVEQVLEALDVPFKAVELDQFELARDAVIFGLRMNSGVNLDEIFERFKVHSGRFIQIVRFLDALVVEGLANAHSNSYSLTQEGRILCDGIGSELPELLAAS